MITFFNSSSRNNRGFCMLDKPKHDMIESSSHLLAGEKFSANKQCELIFGEGTKNCPFTVTVSMHGRNYESVSGCRHASSRVFTLTNTLYNQIQTILYCIMHAILWFLPSKCWLRSEIWRNKWFIYTFAQGLSKTDPLLVHLLSLICTKKVNEITGFQVIFVVNSIVSVFSFSHQEELLFFVYCDNTSIIFINIFVWFCVFFLECM